MVFLDANKAFDRVWHFTCNFVFIIKTTWHLQSILDLVQNYLSDRNQLVVLNGICPSWTQVEAGVPQGSINWSLLFLIQY